MTLTALSDAELLDQARSGDESAFTELYVRHEAAARRLASTYRRLGDPNDLVSGAFERVLGTVRRGAGPTGSFRAYLFVTLRQQAAEQGEKPADQPLDDVPEPVRDGADTEMGQTDRALVTTAFEELPERWQTVLWHTAVEGRQPQELAAVLGVSANAAAALAYRAREKLRQTYLQAHLLASPAPEHEPYRSQLGAYVRDGLSKRDHAAVAAHLEGCESCRELVAELDGVNRMLARSVLPLFLLAGAELPVGAVVAGAAAASGSGSSGVLDKLRRLGPTLGSAAAITAVVAGLAGLGGVMAREDGRVDVAADAADIGASSPGGDDGDGGDGDGGDRSGDGDRARSLFGENDFAVSPFDDDGGLFGSDFAGDDFPSRFVPRSRTGSSSGIARSTRPRTTTPRTAPSGPAAPQTPSSAPPSTSPSDTTAPPVLPTLTTPPPLSFTASSWTPSAVGRGQLSLTIGEPALTTTSAFSTPAPLKLRISLTAGARVHPEAALDGRCTSAGQVIECTLTQPATGTDTFGFDLQVDAAGQTATIVLFRGDAIEAALPAAIPLSRYEDGLALAAPEWSDYSHLGQALALGRLSVGATTTGATTVSGATIRISAGGDAGLLPAAVFSNLVPDGFLELIPPELRDQVLKDVLAPLPAGCAVEGWTAPPSGTPWSEVLWGGLPTTIICQVPDLVPGAAPAVIGGFVAAGLPIYGDGDSVVEDGTLTVTLELQGTTVATHTLTVLPPVVPPT